MITGKLFTPAASGSKEREMEGYAAEVVKLFGEIIRLKKMDGEEIKIQVALYNLNILLERIKEMILKEAGEEALHAVINKITVNELRRCLENREPVR